MMNNNNKHNYRHPNSFLRPPCHSSYPLRPSRLSLPLLPFDHGYTMAVAKLLRDCKKCK